MRITDGKRTVEVELIEKSGVDSTVDLLIDTSFEWLEASEQYQVPNVEDVLVYAQEVSDAENLTLNVREVV